MEYISRASAFSALPDPKTDEEADYMNRVMNNIGVIKGIEIKDDYQNCHKDGDTE